MRSITIFNSNGFLGSINVKVAARHISYRTVFLTILALAFLLPFIFILTALVTHEGVNKCSSLARQKKAVKIFPRPTAGPLRPIVQCQTLKYNMKSRAGRGFTLEELKAAGIPKKLAPTIGIAVDHRRKNRSLEGLQANVQRLKTYKAKLAGDSAPEELTTTTQVQGPYMPIVHEKPTVELVKVTDEMKSFRAYAKLRVERMNQRQVGARLKKAAEAEKEEKK
ncbi:putative 60S ribosomal protein L13-2 [Cocos nucifera]|uniref:60S ribosomal protein L13 n=1 Tax=Cocos nucifera TaxID=13894 RepID=A0A8K0N6Y2_COCNU|nr:putative 60S ribosomal protein L13-2 [Cocos nucifera]